MSTKESWQQIKAPFAACLATLSQLDPEQNLIGPAQEALSLRQELKRLQECPIAKNQPAPEVWLCYAQERCLAVISLVRQDARVDILSLALQADYLQFWFLIWQRLVSQMLAVDWRLAQPGLFRSFFLETGWVAGFDAPDSSADTATLYWLDRAQVLTPAFRFPAPPIETVSLPASQAGRSFQIDVLRLDQLHPLVKGNKWFKLRWHLLHAREAGVDDLLTLGGAYSNHLLATAAAGALLGFRVKLLIRGERPEPLNPLLQWAQNYGAELIYCSRSEFRHYRTPAGQQQLQALYPGHALIPEGGADRLGLRGCQEIWDYIPPAYQIIACASGTAGTLAGLIQAAPLSRKADLRLLGIAVLKGADFLSEDVNRWLQGSDTVPWQIETDYHGRGYAKSTPELRDFIAVFKAANPQLLIEHVYTAKLFWALASLYQAGSLAPDAPLLALHTGGVYPWT